MKTERLPHAENQSEHKRQAGSRRQPNVKPGDLVFFTGTYDSLAYFTAQTICDNNGLVDDQVAINSLLRWAACDAYFGKYAGPQQKQL